MEELVSIVVPVYNVEEYLDECVRSLVDQTYRNLEIILVDDGSTDRSGEMCDRWAEVDSRISVIHKDNEGLGFTRNRGMDAACGKYIFFIDSDDYVDTLLVEKCVHSARNANSEIVVFGRNSVYEDGSVKPDYINVPSDEFRDDAITGELLPGMFLYSYGFGISAWGKMYSLQMLKENKLKFVSEREIISEDAIFALEVMGSVSKASVVPGCLYFYRRRGSSLSRRFREDRQQFNDMFLTKAMEICDRFAYPAVVKDAVCARYLMYSLAHMKQVVGSKETFAKKQKVLQDVFCDEVLRRNVTDRVLMRCNRSSQIFWKLFAKNHFYLCRGLLWYKVHR